MIQKKVSGDYGGESKHMASSALGRIAVKVNGDECAKKNNHLLVTYSTLQSIATVSDYAFFQFNPSYTDLPRLHS